MKKIILSAVIFIVVVIFLVVLYQVIAFSGTATYNGNIFSDVSGNINIERDESGIPHITAKNRSDIFFSMGYLHAQDRLPLIEYYRIIAMGKLSEKIGSQGRVLDVLSKTIGFIRKSNDIVTKLKPQHRDYLTSYIKGINEYKRLVSGKNSVSPEIEPLHWCDTDVISVLLLFEWADSYLNNKELIFPIPRKLHTNSLQDLIPGQYLFTYPEKDIYNISVLQTIRRSLLDFVGTYQEGFSVYIPGSRTKDEQPSLLFNMDDSIRMFPRWYPVSIKTDDEMITGLSIAGLPFIFTGKNANITFSGFNLKVDVQDFCIEQVDNTDKTPKYRNRWSWEEFTSRKEQININGESEDERKIDFIARETVRGPVISDISTDSKKTDTITIRSIIPDESLVDALFEIPFSKTVLEARSAVSYINASPRSYLFFSPDYTLHTYAGILPTRNMRTLFKDYSTSNTGLVNLSSYFTTTTREMIVGTSIFDNEPFILKEYISRNETNRLHRLREIISRGAHLDSTKYEKILTDTHSPLAEKYTPLILSMLEKLPITSARLSRIYFRNWNFHMEKDSVAASIFQCILKTMIAETIEDELRKSKQIVMENYQLLVDNFHTMLEYDRSNLFDDQSTKLRFESRNQIFNRAFLKAMRTLNKLRGPIMENWTWDSIHRGRFGLPLKIEDTYMMKWMQNLQGSYHDGGNTTIKLSSTGNFAHFGTGSITSSSGFFSDNDFYISTSHGISLNPYSEFFSLSNPGKKFHPLKKSKMIYSLKVSPENK